MSKVVYLRVALVLKDGADVEQVVSEMDYNFSYVEGGEEVILTSTIVELEGVS